MKARQPLIVALLIVAFVGVLNYVGFRFNWPLWILISLIGIALLFLFILIGYTIQWTGFRGYDKETEEYTPNRKLVKITKEHQPGKTFWDWLHLLIIPFVLASATLGFGLWQANLAQQQHEYDQKIANQQHQADQQNALNQQEATILQTYIDNIQDLLLNHNLLKSKPTDDVAILARARTLTALQGLDPERKGRLLIFLLEAQLIGFEDNNLKTHSQIIDLSFADLRNADLASNKYDKANLRADLSGADLSHVYFNNADLSDAKLSGADLSGADLSYANLVRADLSQANFNGADLSFANLNGANFTSANLNGADLSFANNNRDCSVCLPYVSPINFTNANLSGAELLDADLSGAKNLTQEQLDQVYSCGDATLPKGLTCHHNQSPP